MRKKRISAVSLLLVLVLLLVTVLRAVRAACIGETNHQNWLFADYTCWSIIHGCPSS